MTGKLTLDHAAHIEVEVSESDGGHEFIIDTGFSDFLYLPEDRIAAWNLPFLGTVPMTLADQSVIIADVYEATMNWFGSSHQVTVTAGSTGCDSLLGMRLLEGCRIELDDVNSEVRLERL